MTSAVGSLFSSHPKDAERAAAAKAALPKAVGGSLADAQYILQQRFHSATAYGKQQFQIAWDSLVAQNPAIAQQALQMGQASDVLNTDPSIRSQLSSEWNALVANIRTDVGNAIQRVGAGVATGAAGAVDPNTNRVTVPFFGTTSIMTIVVVLGLAIAALIFLSRKRA